MPPLPPSLAPPPSSSSTSISSTTVRTTSSPSSSSIDEAESESESAEDPNCPERSTSCPSYSEVKENSTPTLASVMKIGQQQRLTPLIQPDMMAWSRLPTPIPHEHEHDGETSSTASDHGHDDAIQRKPAEQRAHAHARLFSPPSPSSASGRSSPRSIMNDNDGDSRSVYTSSSNTNYSNSHSSGDSKSGSGATSATTTTAEAVMRPGLGLGLPSPLPSPKEAPSLSSVAMSMQTSSLASPISSSTALPSERTMLALSSGGSGVTNERGFHAHDHRYHLHGGSLQNALSSTTSPAPVPPTAPTPSSKTAAFFGSPFASTGPATPAPPPPPPPLTSLPSDSNHHLTVTTHSAPALSSQTSTSSSSASAQPGSATTNFFSSYSFGSNSSRPTPPPSLRGGRSGAGGGGTSVTGSEKGSSSRETSPPPAPLPLQTTSTSTSTSTEAPEPTRKPTQSLRLPPLSRFFPSRYGSGKKRRDDECEEEDEVRGGRVGGDGVVSRDYAYTAASASNEDASGGRRDGHGHGYAPVAHGHDGHREHVYGHAPRRSRESADGWEMSFKREFLHLTEAAANASANAYADVNGQARDDGDHSSANMNAYGYGMAALSPVDSPGVQRREIGYGMLGAGIGEGVQLEVESTSRGVRGRSRSNGGEDEHEHECEHHEHREHHHSHVHFQTQVHPIRRETHHVLHGAHPSTSSPASTLPIPDTNKTGSSKTNATIPVPASVTATIPTHEPIATSAFISHSGSSSYSVREHARETFVVDDRTLDREHSETSGNAREPEESLPISVEPASGVGIGLQQRQRESQPLRPDTDATVNHLIGGSGVVVGIDEGDENYPYCVGSTLRSASSDKEDAVELVLVRQLGEGAFSCVWLARDVKGALVGVDDVIVDGVRRSGSVRSNASAGGSRKRGLGVVGRRQSESWAKKGSDGRLMKGIKPARREDRNTDGGAVDDAPGIIPSCTSGSGSVVLGELDGEGASAKVLGINPSIAPTTRTKPSDLYSDSKSLSASSSFSSSSLSRSLNNDLTNPVTVTGDSFVASSPERANVDNNKDVVVIQNANVGIGSSSVEDDAATRDGRIVAIKMMNRALCDVNDRTRISFVREVEVLRHISHPSIVSYLHSFTTRTHHCLVLEYVSGGELFDLVNSDAQYAKVTEPAVRRMWGELARAVGWMHGVGLVHRDIKLENILLTTNIFDTPLGEPAKGLPPISSPIIKLTDFGLSRFIDPVSPLLSTRCGSESYAAPELVLGVSRSNSTSASIRNGTTGSGARQAQVGYYDGRQTDAWACGVVLYALATRALPFDSREKDRSRSGATSRSGSAAGSVVSGSTHSHAHSAYEAALRRKEMLMRIVHCDYTWPDEEDGVGEGSDSFSTSSDSESCNSHVSQLNCNHVYTLTDAHGHANEGKRKRRRTLASSGLKRVVERLLVRDVSERARLVDLWDEPWMRGEGAPAPPAKATVLRRGSRCGPAPRSMNRAKSVQVHKVPDTHILTSEQDRSAKQNGVSDLGRGNMVKEGIDSCPEEHGGYTTVYKETARNGEVKSERYGGFENRDKCEGLDTGMDTEGDDEDADADTDADTEGILVDGEHIDSVALQDLEPL